MNRILNVMERAARFIGTRAKRLYIGLYGRILKSRIIQLAPEEPNMPLNSEDRILYMEDFEYRDELCNEIANIGALGCLDWWGFKPLDLAHSECLNSRVKSDQDDHIIVDVPAGIPNRWVFLKLRNPVGDQFRINFVVKLESEFTEFQIAFNFRHLMNRIRFMLVDNRELLFQVVEKGSFITPLVSRPLSFEMERDYHCEIRVFKSQYAFSVNGDDVMAIDLPSHSAMPGDELALILFEADNQRVIRAIVRDIHLAIT